MNPWHIYAFMYSVPCSLGYLKEWIYHIVTTDVLVNELYEGHSFVVSAGKYV